MKLHFLLISSGLVFLQSCDPGVQHDKIIQNDSNQELKFYFYKGGSAAENDYTYDSIVVPKKSQLKVYHRGGLGTTTEFEDCKTYADSIQTKVISNDTLHLKTDPNQNTNWKFKVLKKTYKHGGECECRFIFGDKDLD